MALYYNMIFGLLVAEMVLFGIISLPLPSKFRAPLLAAINKPFQSVQVQISIKSILIFILILFLDAFNRARSIDNDLKNVPIGAPFVDRSEIHAKRFYAQRNVYLTGFTLFLTLILIRTYSLVDELIELKKTVRGGALSDKPTKDVAKLKKQLAEKEKELENLQEKASLLKKDYGKL